MVDHTKFVAVSMQVVDWLQAVEESSGVTCSKTTSRER
jgi:hypothetical protein